jgi:hypothetical protein
MPSVLPLSVSNMTNCLLIVSLVAAPAAIAVTVVQVLSIIPLVSDFGTVVQLLTALASMLISSKTAILFTVNLAELVVCTVPP